MNEKISHIVYRKTVFFQVDKPRPKDLSGIFTTVFVNGVKLFVRKSFLHENVILNLLKIKKKSVKTIEPKITGKF